MSVLLNTVQIDWLTVTSFEDRIYETGVKMMEMIGGEKREKRIQQYAGHLLDGRNGGMWVGTAMQHTELHNMIRVWGELAQKSLYQLAGVYQPYRDVLKRIDGQITILEPDGWSQWNYMNRMRKLKKQVAWPKAERRRDGVELATVYVGNRAGSERFYRVYEKLTDTGRKLLRVECELKEGRALSHAKHLKEYANGELGIMRDELAYFVQQDRQLESAFMPHLVGANRPVRVMTKETATGEWILQQCIPAIDKYLNQHNSERTADICYLLAEIISRHVVEWSD